MRSIKVSIIIIKFAITKSLIKRVGCVFEKKMGKDRKKKERNFKNRMKIGNKLDKI